MTPLLFSVLMTALDGGAPLEPEPPLSSCREDGDCRLVDGRCLDVDGGTRSPVCVCASGWCAKKPEGVAGKVACDSPRACHPDFSAGTCVVAPKQGYDFPIHARGPVCACAAGACQLEWVEPIPCASYRDCSFSREPVLHTTSAKKVKRTHPTPVRPCKDGETDAVCDQKTKTCRVVHWSC